MNETQMTEAKRLAATGRYHVMPVTEEMLSDLYTPVGVLRTLQYVSSHSFILESAEGEKTWGRYSFLGFEPKLEFCCKDGICRTRELCPTGEGRVSIQTSCPERLIRELIAKYRSPRIEGLPPFTGGLVGYFSYDYIRYAKTGLDIEAVDDANFNDVDLMLFDQVIAFDHLKQKIILMVGMSLDGDIDKDYEHAKIRLERLKGLVRGRREKHPETLKLLTPPQALFTREEYCEMVCEAKRYIYEGDIFQVVLADRIFARKEGSIFDVYRLLRSSNPSPYMFYLSGDDIELAGASPETLVKLKEGILHTFPLAGTRKRGETRKEDEKLMQELLLDEKELAEHNMLVDLGRNDLGKISKVGTVCLEKYQSIERFSHVMHLGSTVKGEIAEDKDFMDAIGAVLPAGTLSGAPKIRACEIIDKLEGHRRGIYGGAVGYIDFTGNLDMCIAIRMAYAKKDELYVCSGAGIVAESVPENEYQECLNKAMAVMEAVEDAGKEMDV